MEGTRMAMVEPHPAGTVIEAPPDFPVAWEHPGDARHLWTFDRVHWPEPMPPLAFAVAGGSFARALRAAAAAYELPIADVRMRRINTYRYQANVPIEASPEESQARRERSREKLRVVMGRLDEIWSTEWLPEIREHLDWWEGFDLERAPAPALRAHLDETMVRADRIWEIHFLLASPMHGAINQFGKMHREVFGGSTLDAYRLLRGFDNKILRAARALWGLSRRALEVPSIRRTIEDHAIADVIPALGAFPEGRTFLGELRAYLDEYGQRGESLSLDHPSWLEDPAPVLENLKGYLAQPDRDLEGELAAPGGERERLVAEARRRLRGYPGPVGEEFEFLLEAAQHAVVLSEDHNYWIDANGMYHVRRVFVECGRRLADAGVVEHPEDVFCLTLDELREALRADGGLDHRPLVTDRRAEMERFRSVNPPPVLGTRPPAPPGRGASGGLRRGASAEPGVLGGSAGSAGVAREPARVARSLEEAGGLRRGEILVAETLSSSWTPLFAIAAGLVTDTGGILSHAAVVAREYGLPAVLGTNDATSLLKDGDPVEVDGDRGTVRVLRADR
jgi:pyruvate,water dikinase